MSSIEKAELKKIRDKKFLKALLWFVFLFVSLLLRGIFDHLTNNIKEFPLWIKITDLTITVLVLIIWIVYSFYCFVWIKSCFTVWFSKK
jgi:hypothetical protein